MNHLDTTKDFYREAALEPDRGLCCTTSAVWALPELTVPRRMLDMNYGCGTTVHPRDLADQPTVQYLGVGGGRDEQLDDGAGHVVARDQPLAICDKTAGQLERPGREDLFITPSTWFYDGGGCC